MKELTYQILWATIEDYVGLWELHWETNSIFFENTESENLTITKRVVDYLMQNNLIVLFYGKWGDDEELKKIEDYEAMKIIKKDEYWDAPMLGDICIKVGNTEKGRIVYDNKLIDNMPD